MIEEIFIKNDIVIDEISKQTKIPKRTVQRIISNLRKNNIIKRCGSNKTGHWEIIS